MFAPTRCREGSPNWLRKLTACHIRCLRLSARQGRLFSESTGAVSSSPMSFGAELQRNFGDRLAAPSDWSCASFNATYSEDTTYNSDTSDCAPLTISKIDSTTVTTITVAQSSLGGNIVRLRGTVTGQTATLTNEQPVALNNDGLFVRDVRRSTAPRNLSSQCGPRMPCPCATEGRRGPRVRGARAFPAIPRSAGERWRRWSSSSAHPCR